MAAGQRAIPVNWWSTENGINANQLLTLYAAEGGWQGEDENSQPSPPPCAATKACIWPSAASEGAPPLSANWQLLESNDELAQHGMLRLSATLIFALYQSDQIDHRRTKSTPCAAAAATA